jgi:hypothetical protein
MAACLVDAIVQSPVGKRRGTLSALAVRLGPPTGSRMQTRSNSLRKGGFGAEFGREAAAGKTRAVS